MREYILTHRLKIIFIFAFVIRLIALDQSLWLDEATTAMAVTKFSFYDLLVKFAPSDFHPPLYYFLIKIWSNIFGVSEIALRFPSVIFALGTGFLIYKIAKNSKLSIINKSGLWAAAFFLFNPLIVYYSQEARMYLMVVFLIALNFLYYQKHINSLVNKKDQIIFHLTSALMFLTFYGSILYLISLWCYEFIRITGNFKSRLMRTIGLIPGFVIAFILICPLLINQMTNAKSALISVTNWSSVLGMVSMKNILLFPIKFTSGRISFEPKIIYFLLSGIWFAILSAMIALGYISGQMLKGFRLVFFKYLYFIVVPMIFGVIFSFFSPLLQYFRFLYLSIFLSVLLAISVILIPHFSLQWEPSPKNQRGIPSRSKWVSTIARLSVFIGFFIWTFAYVIIPTFHREDWKSLSKIIQYEKAPIYMIESSSDPLKYYDPNLKINDLKKINQYQELAKSIIIIPYTADIHGVNYRKIMNDKNYRLISTETVRGVSYEKWNLD